MSCNNKPDTNKKKKTPSRAKFVEIAVSKLLDAGGSPIDALLLRYTLIHNKPNKVLRRLLMHPRLAIALDRRGDATFEVRDERGHTLAECHLGNDPLLAVYHEVIAAYERQGGTESYRLAQWVLRPPESREAREIKQALLDLIAMELIAVAGWDDQHEEPRFITTGKVPDEGGDGVTPPLVLHHT